MPRSACIVLGLAGLASAATGWAQTPAVAARPVVGAASAADARPASTAASAAASERRVIEDDGVRIEETRVRGEVRSVVVQSKVGGVRPYEILIGRRGRDPSQDASAAGQSAWSLFKF
jgi:hypothetical protein